MDNMSVRMLIDPLDAGRLEEALPQLAPTHSAPVDLEALNEVTGGDVEFAADLVESYISSSHELLRKILDCCARGDRYELGRAVHQLAGASANVYAIRLRELCSDLERAAETVTAAQLEQQMARLTAELALVTDVLAKMP
jgi:HPt (histidine-containing phosphotransfer) domain-containing protein